MVHYTLRILFLSFGLFFAMQVISQNSLNYVRTTGSNASLVSDKNSNSIDLSASPNLISNNAVTENSSLQPIGFDFIYMGKLYTHFIAGNDGQLGLALSASPVTILGGVYPNALNRVIQYPPMSPNSAPVLAAFWDDLKTAVTGSTVRTVVTGTIPNRCRIIEWDVTINAASATFSNPADGKFQIRIYEGTMEIEYVYGKMTIGSGSGVVTASIGFTAGPNDNQFIALQNLTTFTFTSLAINEPATRSLVNTSSQGVINGLHSVSDGNRCFFRFLPPQLQGSVLTTTISDVGSTSMQLNWTDNFTNENGFTIYRSIDNINFAPVTNLPANSITYNATQLLNNTRYYWKVHTFCEGDIDSTAIFSDSTRCSMGGTFTIGATGNFTSITQALDTLIHKGIAASIIFEIQSNYTSAGEVFPVVFPKNIQCRQLNFNMTVRPAAGIVNIDLVNNTSSPMFILDSINNVYIDGRPGGTGTAKAFSFKSNGPVFILRNAWNNSIIYSNIRTAYTGLGGAAVTLEGTQGIGSDNNLINQCEISDNNTSVPRILIRSNTSGSIDNRDNSIIDCNLYNFSVYGLALTAGNKTWTIKNNSFYHTKSITADSLNAGMIAIEEPGLDTNFVHTIVSNYFGGSQPQCAGLYTIVNFKLNYGAVVVKGRTHFVNNQFKKLFLRYSEPGTVFFPTIKILESAGLIRNNQFGGLNEDSIAVLNQSLSEIKMDVISLNASGLIQQQVDSNYLRNIRLQATSTGSVELTGLRSNGHSMYVLDNKIGGEGSAGIINFTKGTVNGMIISSNSISSTSKTRVSNNSITHITAYGQLNAMELSSNTIYGNRNRIIDQNTIAYLTAYGLRLTGITINALAGRVVNNKIFGLTIIAGTANESRTLYGIYVYTSSVTDTITGNLIHSLQSPGVQFPYSCSIAGISMLAAGSYVNIHNNMIRLGLDTLGNSITSRVNFTGIGGGPVNTADIRHNTVYIAGTGVPAGNGGSSCVAHDGGVYIYNNYLINKRSSTGTGDPVNSIFTTGSGVNSYYHYYDHNVYFTQGSLSCFARAFINFPVFYTTFGEWKTVTGKDLHSIHAIPNLANPDAQASSIDLHVQSPTPTEGKGGTGLTVQFDFDEQNRSGLTPVDIGADAGNFVLADAWPPELVPDSIPNHGKDSLQRITVRIKDDSGTDTLGNLKPRMWFRKFVPVTSAWYSVPGELIQGNLNDGTWKFTIDYSSIGLAINISDSIQCYFVAQDTTSLHNVGYAPLQNANHTDINTQNNTPTITYKYQVTGQLPDSILVGTGQLYTSLTNNAGAFYTINNSKIGQNGITLIITSDLSESGTHSLTNFNWGDDSIRIVTNTPVLKTISNSGNLAQSMIKFVNSSNILIDGSVNSSGNYLLFRNTNAQVEHTTSVIEFGDYSKRITLRNSTIESNASYYISGGLPQPNLVIGLNNTNVIIHNNIFRGTTPSTTITIGIFSGNKVPGLKITDNFFTNFERTGIDLRIAADSCIITGNHFYFTATTSAYSSQAAINVNSFVSAGNTPGGGHTIADNYIGGTQPFCGGTPWIYNGSISSTGALGGIVVISSNDRKTHIYNNTIKNIRINSTSNILFTGISGTGFVDIGGSGGNIIGDPAVQNSIWNAGSSPTASVSTSAITLFEITDGLVASNNIISNLTASGTTHTVIRGISSRFILYNGTGTALIENNVIQNLQTSGNQAQASPAYSAAGIAIEGFGNSFNFIIRRNSISSVKSNGTANSKLATGFYIDANNCVTTIQRNRITGIENNAASNGQIAGIYLLKGYHKVENNQVSLTNGSNTNTILITGIDDRTNNNNNTQNYSRYYYNSICIGGTAAGNSNSYSANFQGALKIDKFKNNILYNNRSGGTGKHLALGVNIPSNISLLWPVANSDNNFLVAPDTTNLVQWTGSGFMNLQSFKQISGGDISSHVRPVSSAHVDSLFTNSSAGDLNINFNKSQCWYVNGKGLPISDISDDYNSINIRSTSIQNGPTDIGSDEFNTSTTAIERICPGSNISFSSSLTGTTYRWQLNSGTGFTNIIDDANYTGTNTGTLHLNNIPSTWYDYKYRCVVDGNNSEIISIRFLNTWTGAINSTWENPGNWSCGTVPDNNTDIVINSGTVIISSNVTIRSLILSPNATLIVNPGNTLTITH